MQPVLIFRHVACEGPGYLVRVLDTRKIPHHIIRIDEGMQMPPGVEGMAGLVFMGGPMSVNDNLPWIKEELALIRSAHHEGIPVLGHCLGAQLISKALGGEVVRNPVPEIGWFSMERTGSADKTPWLQDLSFATECFHWHGETFSLPVNAQPLFRTRHCRNQGFVLGNSLALQCHVEMEADMVPVWLKYYENELPTPSPSVQSAAEMLRDVERRISALHTFADVLYAAWLKGFDTV